MSGMDILRSFAATHCGDDEIVPGVTYGTCRAVLAEVDRLTAEVPRLGAQHRRDALDGQAALDERDMEILWLRQAVEARDEQAKPQVSDEECGYRDCYGAKWMQSQNDPDDEWYEHGDHCPTVTHPVKS